MTLKLILLDAIPLCPLFITPNSAKYTPSGGRIWLTVAAEGEHFTIRVRDTGEGISVDILPRIFEMFTQVEASAPPTILAAGSASACRS